MARLARVGEDRDAVPIGERRVVVETGLAPASPVGGGHHPRAARRQARGELVIQVRKPDGMPGREHDPISSITGKTQPLGRRSARVEDRPRADLDRPGTRLAVDRRAGGGLDQVEHPVQGATVLQTR